MTTRNSQQQASGHASEDALGYVQPGLAPPGPASHAIGETVTLLRKSFDEGITRPLEWRERQLDALIRMLDEKGEFLAEALERDLGKSKSISLSTEIPTVRTQILFLRQNLRDYTAPKRVPTTLLALPSKSYIMTEPLGLVLVISPWNFPLELGLVPLAGAIAAGNCAILKPSEVAAHISSGLAECFAEFLDQDCVRVVEGAAEETTTLLAERFDHIFYTGNGTVGRIVLRAAAEHLTPVTLELGGKSPVIVDNDCNLEVAARRIIWGKFFNCGQACVAADYLLVHREIYVALLDRLKETIVEFYGKDPQKSADYGRIINGNHHRRVMRLLDESGATIAHGGQADEADRYIAPTILTQVRADSSLMQEEIFGPLLPLLPIDDIDEAIHFVNARPKPLALYYFGNNSKNRDAILNRTSSGGAAVNQILFQMLGPHLPFGGVGASGMGKYHGRYSIDAFSNQKGVVERPTYFDPNFAYPPSTKGKRTWLKRLL
jgi:aldehyde dehydrogenase (NAD+)